MGSVPLFQLVQCPNMNITTSYCGINGDMIVQQRREVSATTGLRFCHRVGQPSFQRVTRISSALHSYMIKTSRSITKLHYNLRVNALSLNEVAQGVVVGGLVTGAVVSSLPLWSGYARERNTRRYLRPTKEEEEDNIRWSIMAVVSCLPYLNFLVCNSNPVLVHYCFTMLLFNNKFFIYLFTNCVQFV